MSEEKMLAEAMNPELSEEVVKITISNSTHELKIKCLPIAYEKMITKAVEPYLPSLAKLLAPVLYDEEATFRDALKSLDLEKTISDAKNLIYEAFPSILMIVLQANKVEGVTLEQVEGNLTSGQVANIALRQLKKQDSLTKEVWDFFVKGGSKENNPEETKESR